VAISGIAARKLERYFGALPLRGESNTGPDGSVSYPRYDEDERALT